MYISTQAQKCVRDLEAQLEELKAAGEGPTEELKVPTTPLQNLRCRPAYKRSPLSDGVCVCFVCVYVRRDWRKRRS